MNSVAIYGKPHTQRCASYETVRHKDKERIEELIKELGKYGLIIEEEDAREPQTNLHLIVKVPYKVEIIRK